MQSSKHCKASRSGFSSVAPQATSPSRGWVWDLFYKQSICRVASRVGCSADLCHFMSRVRRPLCWSTIVATAEHLFSRDPALSCVLSFGSSLQVRYEQSHSNKYHCSKLAAHKRKDSNIPWLGRKREYGVDRRGWYCEDTLPQPPSAVCSEELTLKDCAATG